MSFYLSVAEHARGMSFNNFIMLILLNFRFHKAGIFLINNFVIPKLVDFLVTEHVQFGD